MMINRDVLIEQLRRALDQASSHDGTVEFIIGDLAFRLTNVVDHSVNHEQTIDFLDKQVTIEEMLASPPNKQL